jgi:hypothetical protein
MEDFHDGKAFDVRDIRNRNWLWTRRELIRAHGQELGVYGVAVYVALASFADTKTQSRANPSISTLAELLGISRNKVRDGIRKLAELDWIAYRSREADSGRRTSHEFRLLECPVEDPYNRNPPKRGDPSRDEGGTPHDMKGDPSRDEGHEEKENGKDREKDEVKGSNTNPVNNPETNAPGGEPGQGLEGKAKKVWDTLLTKGVSKAKADALVREHGPARCARQIRHFEIKVEDGQDVGPGLLVTLIQEDRELPTPTRRRESTHEGGEGEDVSDVNPRDYFHHIPGTPEYREQHGTEAPEDEQENTEPESEQQLQPDQ